VSSSFDTTNPLTALRVRLVGSRRALLVSALVGAALGVAIAWLIPATYTSSTSFVPQNRPSAPSGLSGLAAQFGVAIAAGEPAQTPAFYVSLLQSRLVLERTVATPFDFRDADGRAQRETLTAFLRAKGATPAARLDDAVRRLNQALTATVQQRTGIVSVAVRTRQPMLSQEVARYVVALIDEFNRKQRQSQAAAERAFTERRLAAASSELRDAEARLEQFLSTNREVSNSPLLQLLADRLRRDVDLRQQVYTTLSQSLERAKIDEVRDTPVITVIDPANLPARADSRHLGEAGALGALVALVLVAMWVARREVRDVLA
jgi:uncharacterized protein involved in exopolysaccharide biosynthesis